MKKYFKKFSPSKETITSNKLLSPIAHLLTNSRIWHFNRHSVAGGVAVGLFFSMFPIPMQMLFSAFFAVVVFEVNLPLAVVSVWVTNPATMPIIFPINYFIGAFILGRDTNLPEHFSFTEIFHFGIEIIVPLLLGSLVMAIICAAVSYVCIQAIWKYNVYQDRKTRKLKMLSRKLDKIKEQSDIENQREN